MKKFMDKDFLLETETAKTLYHEYAAQMPIYDFHNHLSAKEIYEDHQYDNIAQVWLGGDHYKWRALRANGISESLITGNDSRDYEKFIAWAKTVPNTFGNPLYHWTHLELQRYFDVQEPLSEKTAEDIWNTCNAKLHTKEYSVRNLLKKMNVKVLCTTDDPTDDLHYHNAIKEENCGIEVRPTFRPENAMGIDKSTFHDYVKKLDKAAGITIKSYVDLKQALSKRIEYFDICGCCISDHSLDANLYANSNEEELNLIFLKGMNNEPLLAEEIAKFKGNLLVFLGTQYEKHNWAMQLHVGAIRNNSSRMFEKLGPDTGFDSMDDFNYAGQLSALLDAMDSIGQLPKTILYCLNPKDNEMLASMTGNFQDGKTPGKIQLGSAWWFCDHKKGMEKQMQSLSEAGLLSRFVGMVTDSRSFLSFPRHEYFRRILCNYVGTIVENGEYPCDMSFLGNMIENICYNNIVNYLKRNH